ncbi:MAG: CHAD domain-containing protein, partial [Acidimicrobiales bacterium]|nr:CHAD domain-containing protein [Acidimicrobiales bacterium]
MASSELTSGTGPPGGVEVEWQFDALDLRPVERWLAALGSPSARPSPPASPALPEVAAHAQRARRQVDVYLDTEDWRVRRAGFVLRVRKRAGGAEATLKDTAPAKGGLRRRLEVTEQLSTETLDTLDGEGPVRRRLRALCGRMPLVPVLEVRTHRRPYHLVAGDEQLAEVALDDTVVAVGSDEPLRLRRVEVEVMAGRAEDLTPLVERMSRECGLWPATLSKFEAGVMAAGLQLPELPDVGPTSIPEQPTIGDVAYAVLRRNALAMLAHEPGTRLGEDPEDLHDMRVATRRLRAGLSLFAEALPVGAKRLRDELGWLGGLLGAVRDLDVELGRMGEWRAEVGPEDRDALGDLVAIVEQHREEERRALLAGLESARYRRLTGGLVSMLQKGPSRRLPAARTLAAVAAPGLVGDRHKAATKAAKRAKRSGIPADFHRLRIRCKRLRYALEFVAEVYEHKTAGFVRQLVGLQDSLGLLQDAEVAGARLRAQVDEGGSSLKPRTVFAMGIAAERHRAQADRLLRRLPGQVKVLKGSRWRKLESLMEHQRTEAALTVPPSPARRARPARPRPSTSRPSTSSPSTSRPSTSRPSTSRIVSADGTTIAFEETGEGPALILVDG